MNGRALSDDQRWSRLGFVAVLVLLVVGAVVLALLGYDPLTWTMERAGSVFVTIRDTFIAPVANWISSLV